MNASHVTYAVVIPTYNEHGNIRKLVERILALKIPSLHIIIVDDNSPDGTGALADALVAEYDNVHVIHRQKKEGLGKAYIAGFHKAFDLGADAIQTMDADFSHDPERIPAFRKSIEDADVVIGSRYTQGGGVSNWNWTRRLISKLGNFYAHTVLQTPIHDMTTGFRCYRRNVLETVDIETLSSSGYVVLVELAYKSYQHGFRVVEIPITFTERAAGVSKFNLKIFFEAYLQILRLRSKGRPTRKS